MVGAVDACVSAAGLLAAVFGALLMSPARMAWAHDASREEITH